MSISVELSQLKGFRGIESYQRILHDELASATGDAALRVQSRTKLQIRGGPARSGRNRTLKGKKRGRASARGQYPKALTNDLKRSILANHSTGKLSAKVGSNLLYAKILEDIDRKHVTRAADELEDTIFKLAEKATITAARRASGG